MKRLPLTGIRVLDLGRILAAPLAAQSLGDLGAEVIKVERPGAGDGSRHFGPPFLKDRDGHDTHESPMYLSANRNKRSVTIDLAQPLGQELVRQLAAQSDVLIENYKVGDLERYGLDYASIRAINPRIIYCSVTGFGQSGPYSARPGYDTVFQGMSGMMSVTGLPDGVPGGGPMKTGPSMADFLSGQYATEGILAALYERDTHSGEGQHIDIALLDCMIAAQSHYVATYLATGVVPVRRGTEGNGGLPSQAFPCQDAGVVVICGTEPQYRAFCQALGHPELGTDPRFATNALRVANRVDMTRTFNALTQSWRAAELLQALMAAGVPCGPINNYAEVFADPQVQHRGLVQAMEHAQAGPMQLCANPIRFTGHAPRTPLAPPVLGQHTQEVLQERLGLDTAALSALQTDRII